MITELTGARVLAPMFGTSLFVWSAVLAITLLGLASGYFFGGKISTKTNSEKKLFYILVCAGIFMMCVPILAKFINLFAFYFPLLVAVTFSSLLILFPPLFFMGMVSPLIIQSLIDENNAGGKRSGEVYAVSTVGGIVFTFLTGFWLLPSFGNSTTLIVAGMCLLMPPLFFLVYYKNTFNAIIIFAFALFIYYTNTKNKIKKDYVKYESEGIFGKVEVVDFIYENAITKKKMHPRYLMVNNIIQSQIDLKDTLLLEDYPAVIDCTIIKNGESKNALIFGLGGGTIANLFAKKKYNVTAVELDERICLAAKKYFSLNKKIKVVIDDARHYLNTLNNKYNYIIIDVFKGEEPPYYVLTNESITKMKNCLTTDGVIIVNTYHYLAGTKAEGNKAILKTFLNSKMIICTKITGTKKEDRNLLIYANNSNNNLVKENTYLSIMDKKKLLNSKTKILSDNNCPLDFLNAEAGMEWRKNYINYFILNRE